MSTGDPVGRIERRAVARQRQAYVRIMLEAALFVLLCGFALSAHAETNAPPTRWQSYTAMREHKRSHPACEVCGYKRIETCHIIPRSIEPRIAADTNNFVSLYSRCERQCRTRRSG